MPRKIESYTHNEADRLNNPPAGLVDPATDPGGGQKKYKYDPHVDPALQFDPPRGGFDALLRECLTETDGSLSAVLKKISDLKSSLNDRTSSPERKEYAADIIALLDSVLETLKQTPEKLKALLHTQEPYLNWAGKAEHTSFEVPTVSLHVHERIDPLSIMEAVQKNEYNTGTPNQPSLFAAPIENPPLRTAIEFYKHRHNWSNRLIAGDSTLVMNSLLEKEGMAGKVQMIYIDPPYGIKYGSNFQPFVNRREVKDGKDEDLTAEPETIRAFRDTWELGIHSYLTYLRDRLLLSRELLTESGSIFVQISDENVHRVRCLMDEVFGAENFCGQIHFRTKLMPFGSKTVEPMHDYILWYCKAKATVKVRKLFTWIDASGDSRWHSLELPDGSRRPLTKEETRNHLLIAKDARVFTVQPMRPAEYRPTQDFPVIFDGVKYNPPSGSSWSTHQSGLARLITARRVAVVGSTLGYVLFLDDYPVTTFSTVWADTAPANRKAYVVQTNANVVTRCLLMTTDPGDLVFDPTCGSGTTAYVAEQWGRRWITCDTSRVAVTLARQRLMTASFDYYELAKPSEGVSSGFKYKTVPHITLKSIANNPEIKEGMSREHIDRAIQKYADQETLYDQPFVDSSKARVTGPFTVEAVPAPTVMTPGNAEIVAQDGQASGGPRQKAGRDTQKSQTPDASIARQGPTLRQAEWRAEILKTGIRGRQKQRIDFSRVEVMPGTRWIHADAESKDGRRIVLSFGPEHGPIDASQVSRAVEEARTLVPKPEIIVFAAFQFDPEAAKDIDETNWPGVTLLKAQMNADLLTEDLKKKRSSNESFWLIGQPDVHLKAIKKGPDKGKFQVTVHGFDYYNTRTGEIDSGSADRIALWMLDPDYDGRSLFPRQVFFPLAGDKEGWAKLARNLKAEIDEDLIQAYRGTESLPFNAGAHKRCAVKIIDDRGVESVKVIGLE